MNKIFFILFLALFFTTTFSSAQVNEPNGSTPSALTSTPALTPASDNPYTQLYRISKTYVGLELASVLNGGIGLVWGYQAKPNVSYAAYFNYTSRKTSSLYMYKDTFTELGARADMMFYQPIEQRGFYGAVLINYVAVKSVTTDDVLTNSSLTTEDKKFGFGALFGYQLDYKIMEELVRFKVGAGVKNGASVEHSQNVTGFNQKDSGNQLQHGLFLELALNYFY